ncbi:MAG: hypothetical protein AAB431_00265 [Patescibacteria group bacterium]
MDGISAQWAHTVFMERWRLNEQVRRLEEDNEQLSSENARIAMERDRIKAQFKALHRKQFKAGKRKHVEPSLSQSREKKKRGPPMGHPPWNRPVPKHIDKFVCVPPPAVCPHCKCDNLSPSKEKVEQVQEDIVIQPRTFVTCYKHDTAFCPDCGRTVFDTAPGELRNCSIGPVTKAVAVWLHHGLKLPFRDVRALFASLFAMNFVPASAVNFSLTAAERSQPLYDDLREKIRSANLLQLHICFTLVSFEGSFMRYGFPKEFGGVCRAVCHGRGM